MLTLITPTGDRPVPFALCVDYVNRSTRRPDIWIVVDDGRDPATREALARAEVEVNYIHPEPMEGHSLIRNLRLACDEVTAGSDVAIFEDDDYYPAEYLEGVEALLRQGAHCCGAYHHHFFNLGNRCWKVYRNDRTLCTHSLGFSWEGFDFFAETVESHDGVNIDSHLGDVWPHDRLGRRAHEKILPTHLVGWRCCTARPGITPGHRRVAGGKWQADPEGRQLAAWIGEAEARRIIDIEQRAFEALEKEA